MVVQIATFVAALFHGRPDIYEDLLDVCHRESRCQPLGAHEIDSHLSRRGWVGQVRWGHLEPSCQPYVKGTWATWGAFGLAAASHWEYLPPCYPPQALANPWVSAWVAAEKYLRRCDSRSTQGWCPSRADRRKRLQPKHRRKLT